MRITATRTSATLAGIWTALGLWVFGGAVASAHPRPWLHEIAFIAFALAFFLLPVALFVEGFDSKRLGWRYGFSRDYWKQAPHSLLRGMFWFMSFVATSAIFSLIEKN